MMGETQRFWIHQVPETTVAVGLRINLTFRRTEPTHVASVASLVYADNRPEWQQIAVALQHR